jgi:hypothetical protein
VILDSIAVNGVPECNAVVAALPVAGWERLEPSLTASFGVYSRRAV